MATKTAPATTPLGGPGFTRGSTRTGNGRVLARDYINAEWSYPQLYRTSDQMYRTDPVVRAAVLMVLLPVVEATWNISPASPDPVDAQAAEFVRRALLEHLDWSDVLWQLLSPTMRYGHAVLEEVWESVEWSLSVPAADGSEETQPKRPFWVPAAFVQRPGESIVDWKFDDLGAIEEVRQLVGPVGDGRGRNLATIPGDRLVVLFNEREGQDDLGRPLLRSMYRAWYAKEKLEIIDMIRAEKAGVGVPIGKAGRDVPDEDLAKLEEQLAAFTVNEAGYLILAGMSTEDGQGMDVEMLDMKAGSTADVLSSLRYHVEQILWSVLGAWQNLGQGEVGARATAEAQDDPFYLALQYVAGRAASAFSRQHIPRLVAYNFPEARPPLITVSNIQGTDIWETGRAIAQLVTSGAITHDDQLEAHIREAMGLPPRTPEEEVEQPPNEPPVVIPGEDPTQPPEPPAATPPAEPAPAGDAPKPQDPGMRMKAQLARVVDDIARVGGMTYREAADIYLAAGSPPPTTAFLELVAAGAVEHQLVSRSEAEALLSKRQRPWRREPTYLEAAHVSLSEIDAVISAQRLRFSRLLDEHAKAIARHLADRALPDEAEERLRHEVHGTLAGIVDYGRSTVRNEVASQKGQTPAVLTVPRGDAIDKWLTRQARRASAAILSRLESAADRLRSRTVEPSHAVIVASLETEAERALRAEATATVSLAFNAGRMDEQASLGEDGWTAQYSSVLDSATCNPCATLDGEEYDVGSDDYERDYPPLVDCEGGDACRCMMILVAPSEAPG